MFQNVIVNKDINH